MNSPQTNRGTSAQDLKFHSGTLLQQPAHAHGEEFTHQLQLTQRAHSQWLSLCGTNEFINQVPLEKLRNEFAMKIAINFRRIIAWLKLIKTIFSKFNCNLLKRIMITIFKVLALFFPVPSTKPIGELSSSQRVGEREKRLFCVCGIISSSWDFYQ